MSDLADMATHCRRQAASLARTLDMAHEELRHAVAQDRIGVPTIQRSSPMTPADLRRTIAGLEADRALWTQLADEATAHLARPCAGALEEPALFDEGTRP